MNAMHTIVIKVRVLGYPNSICLDIRNIFDAKAVKRNRIRFNKMEVLQRDKGPMPDAQEDVIDGRGL